jgi:hypothetical protein
MRRFGDEKKSIPLSSPFTRCGSGLPPGRLHRRGPTESFESYQVLPDHRYYTTGARNLPDAILAVDGRCTLQGTLWREEEMTEKRLMYLVYQLQQSGVGLIDFPVGMAVLGPEGEKIGYWYSDLTFTTVEMPGPGEVLVHSPAKIRAARTDLQRAVDQSD